MSSSCVSYVCMIWMPCRCLEASCVALLLGNAPRISDMHLASITAQIKRRKGSAACSAYLLCLQLLFHPHQYSNTSASATVMYQCAELVEVLAAMVKDAAKKSQVVSRAFLIIFVMLVYNNICTTC